MAVDQSLSQWWIDLIVAVRVVVARLLAEPGMEFVVLELLLLLRGRLLVVVLLLESVEFILIVLVLRRLMIVLVIIPRRGNCGRWQSHNRLDGTLLVLLLQLVALLGLVVRAESHMDSTVAVELFRIRPDDRAQGGGLDGRRQRHNQWLLVVQRLFFVVVILLVVLVGRKCRHWLIDDDTAMRIFLVFHVEDLHLFLLLLPRHLGQLDGLRNGQRIVAVLDDNLNDRLGRLDVLRIVVVAVLLLRLLAIIALVDVIALSTGWVIGLGIGVVISGGDSPLQLGLPLAGGGGMVAGEIRV